MSVFAKVRIGGIFQILLHAAINGISLRELRIKLLTEPAVTPGAIVLMQLLAMIGIHGESSRNAVKRQAQYTPAVMGLPLLLRSENRQPSAPLCTMSANALRRFPP
jgi:hypothetical protein